MLCRFSFIWMFVICVDQLFGLPDGFQSMILSKLELDSPPNNSNNPSSDANGLSGETSCVNFFKNLNLVDKNIFYIECFDLLFKIDKPSSLTFSVARSSTGGSKFEIQIFRKKIQNYQSNREMIEISNDNRFVRKDLGSDFGWLDFDVTELVQLQKEKQKIVLKIKVLSSDNMELDYREFGLIIDHDNLSSPFLISYSQEKNFTRSRRQTASADDDNEDVRPISAEYDDQSKHCQAVPIYYKFEDYGWDEWILSPKGFSSSLCQGRCAFPLKSELRPTNHAIIQSLMQLLYPDKFPEPCCTADRTESLQIVYFENNNSPKFKRLDNIIIRSCRCM